LADVLKRRGIPILVIALVLFLEEVIQELAISFTNILSQRTTRKNPSLGDQVSSLCHKNGHETHKTHKYASRSHKEESLPWFHRWKIVAIELLPFNAPDEYFFGGPKGWQLQSRALKVAREPPPLFALQRMKRRTRMISIRYGAPDSGAR
jgi:hypothetical protein